MHGGSALSALGGFFILIVDKIKANNNLEKYTGNQKDTIKNVNKIVPKMGNLKKEEIHKGIEEF